MHTTPPDPAREARPGDSAPSAPRVAPDSFYRTHEFAIVGGMRWALRQFAARPLPMLVPGIIILIVTGIVALVSHWLTPTSLTTHLSRAGEAWSLLISYTPPPFDAQTVLVFAIGYVVTLTSTLMLQNAMLSGSIWIAEGRPATVRRFVVPRNWNVMVNVTTVLCVAIIVGAVLFIVPALVALFFLQFAIVASLADENPTVRGSLKKSIAIVRSRPLASLLILAVLIVTVLVGYLVFYVGTVVTGPIAALFLTYSYFALDKREIIGVPPHHIPSRAAA